MKIDTPTTVIHMARARASLTGITSFNINTTTHFWGNRVCAALIKLWPYPESSDEIRIVHFLKLIEWVKLKKFNPIR